GSESALRARIASRTAERALIDYLASLPPDVLFKLRALMYAGRGDSDDVLGLHAQLGNDLSDVDAAVSSMVEKSPLPQYLQEGLDVAVRESIELDDVWPAPPDEPAPIAGTPATRGRAERTFPPGHNPINDAGTIFTEIAAEWTGDA